MATNKGFTSLTNTAQTLRALKQAGGTSVDLSTLESRVTTNEGDIASLESDVTAHLSASDPHPQYLLKADLVIDGGDFGDTYIPTSLDFDGGSF